MGKLLFKLTNNAFKKGKKGLGERVILDSICVLKRGEKKQFHFLLGQILKNVKPLIFLKKKKVGGVRYRIPAFLHYEKGVNLGLKWLTSHKNSKDNSYKNLLQEMENAIKNKGSAVDSKKSLYELAILNRAYIKYL